VIPTAHVAGLPIEETIALYGPAIMLTVGAALTMVRARVRRARRREPGPR
jgi:hypothetical protein